MSADIPSDVMKRAKAVWECCLDNGTPDAALMIAAVILAERERCAKIAQFANVRADSVGRREVAARIRSSQPTGE